MESKSQALEIGYSIVALIRHGERADRVWPLKVQFDNEFDPPLTELGIKQAQGTGKYLANYLKKNGLSFDKVMVESSPFVRTLMTAGQIAPYLGVSEIQVNYQLSEALDTDCFNSDPMPHLDLVKSGFDFSKLSGHVQNAIPEGVSFTELSGKFDLEYKAKILKGTFPESHEEFRQRSFDTAIHLIQRCQEMMRQNPGQRILYLGVSHGYHIDQYAHLITRLRDHKVTSISQMAQGTKLNEAIVKGLINNSVYQSPRYCAISGLSIDVNGDLLIHHPCEKNSPPPLWRNYCRHVGVFYM